MLTWWGNMLDVVDRPYRGGRGIMLTWWGIMLTWWGIMLDVVDRPYRGGRGIMLTWWGIMLTWWGIMLDVVDTPYRGGVLCLRGGALCSASVWHIHHSSAYRFASVILHPVDLLDFLQIIIKRTLVFQAFTLPGKRKGTSAFQIIIEKILLCNLHLPHQDASTLQWF